MSETIQPVSNISFLKSNWANIVNPLGFSFIAYILYFIINFFGTQLFIPEIYGDLFLAWSWIVILGSGIMLGVDQSCRIFVSNYLFKRDQESIKTYLHWGLRFVRKAFLCSFIIAIICQILFDPLSISKNEIYHSEHNDWHSFFSFIFLATPVVGIANWISSLLIAYKKTSASTFMQFTATDLTLIIIMGLFYAFAPLPLSGHSGRSILMSSFMITSLIGIMLCIIKIEHFYKICFSSKYILQINKSWAPECLKQASNMLIYNLIANLDIILMGFFEKGNSDVAYYNLALMIINLVVMTPYSVFQYITPDINFFLKKQVRTQELQTLWNKTLIINGLIVLSISGITFLYLDQILAIFGEKYIAAKPFVIILLGGNCFAAALGAPYFILQYGNHVKKFVQINLLCIITMIIIAKFLVPAIGSIGIAYASISCVILQNLSSAFMVKRHTLIKPLGFI